MSERTTFDSSLEGFGVNSPGEKEKPQINVGERLNAMHNLANHYGGKFAEKKGADIRPFGETPSQENNEDEEATDARPFSVRRAEAMEKMMHESKPDNVNFDETEILKEAWKKEYKNCLVNIEAVMRKKRMTIEEVKQEVLDWKSDLPRASREFITSVNPKYIEGWLSRMFSGFKELLDWINERDAENKEKADNQEVTTEKRNRD